MGLGSERRGARQALLLLPQPIPTSPKQSRFRCPEIASGADRKADPGPDEGH